MLLNSFSLFNKVITFVKDKGSNLATLTYALTFVVSCFPFQLQGPFVGSYFGMPCQKLHNMPLMM
jgi:hypothetical protein